MLKEEKYSFISIKNRFAKIPDILLTDEKTKVQTCEIDFLKSCG